MYIFVICTTGSFYREYIYRLGMGLVLRKVAIYKAKVHDVLKVGNIYAYIGPEWLGWWVVCRKVLVTSDVASGRVARYHRRLFNIRIMTRGAVHAGFSPHAGPFCREKGVQSRVAVVGSSW